MDWRIATLGLLCATLTSCSYVYDILAVARDGKLVFIIDPKSENGPTCFRQIEVVTREGATAMPSAGDDGSRVGYGTFWFESIDYDDACKNKFPITYAAALDGDPQADSDRVKPKPLLRNVIYEISTTTGATGYGGGRFKINANGTVENLKDNLAVN